MSCDHEKRKRRSRESRRMSDAELDEFNMAHALRFSNMLRQTALLQWSTIEVTSRKPKGDG